VLVGAQLDVALAEERARGSILSQTDTAALTDAAVRATPEQIVVVVAGEVEFTLLRLFISEGRFDLQVLARASRDIEPADTTQSPQHEVLTHDTHDGVLRRVMIPS
jgi:hypothetical protein